MDAEPEVVLDLDEQVGEPDRATAGVQPAVQFDEAVRLRRVGVLGRIRLQPPPVVVEHDLPVVRDTLEEPVERIRPTDVLSIAQPPRRDRRGTRCAPRTAPTALRTLDIKASSAAKPLLEAVDVLRDDSTARPTTCAMRSAPTTSGWRGRAATAISERRCCRPPSSTEACRSRPIRKAGSPSASSRWTKACARWTPRREPVRSPAVASRMACSESKGRKPPCRTGPRPLQYRLGGTADTWTPACRMALYLFGIDQPAAGVLAEFGRWGHVLLANGYAGAPIMASTS